MGYGNLRKGDYQNAYDAYGAAVEQYHGTVDTWGETRCKANMAKINQKQGNPDELVGFYRPAPDVDQSLFYPPMVASGVPVSGS